MKNMESRAKGLVSLSGYREPLISIPKTSLIGREPTLENFWNKTKNQIVNIVQASYFCKECFAEIWMKGHFSDSLPFTLCLSLFLIRTCMSHPSFKCHTLNIKCGRCPIFVMKYRISTNMRDTHTWLRKQCGHEKSEQIIDKYFERKTLLHLNCGSCVWGFIRWDCRCIPSLTRGQNGAREILFMFIFE